MPDAPVPGAPEAAPALPETAAPAAPTAFDVAGAGAPAPPLTAAIDPLAPALFAGAGVPPCPPGPAIPANAGGAGFSHALKQPMATAPAKPNPATKLDKPIRFPRARMPRQSTARSSAYRVSARSPFGSRLRTNFDPLRSDCERRVALAASEPRLAEKWGHHALPTRPLAHSPRKRRLERIAYRSRAWRVTDSGESPLNRVCRAGARVLARQRAGALSALDLCREGARCQVVRLRSSRGNTVLRAYDNCTMCGGELELVTLACRTSACRSSACRFSLKPGAE
jgi:hypothetical protein